MEPSELETLRDIVVRWQRCARGARQANALRGGDEIDAKRDKALLDRIAAVQLPPGWGLAYSPSPWYSTKARPQVELCVVIPGGSTLTLNHAVKALLWRSGSKT